MIGAFNPFVHAPVPLGDWLFAVLVDSMSAVLLGWDGAPTDTISIEGERS